MHRRLSPVFFALTLATSLTLLGLGLSSFVPPVSAKIKLGNLPKEAAAKQLLKMRDGREYTLAGLRGQVVVLDFITVWCAHSRDHVPALNRFDDEDRERGLKVIGLILQDSETNEARVQRFIKEQGVTYPVGLIDYKTFERFIETDDTGVPQTLVFGRNGRLAGYFEGHNDQTAKAIHETVERELNKPR